jgi:AraC-like DNA-binding protein
MKQGSGQVSPASQSSEASPSVSARVKPPIAHWPDVLSCRPPATRSELHRHHAMHLVVALQGEIRVHSPGADEQVTFGMLSAPNCYHGVDTTGAEVLVIFFAPESQPGASLRSAVTGSMKLLDDETRNWFRSAPSHAELTQPAGQAWLVEMVARLGGEHTTPRVMDRRVLRALQFAREALPEQESSLKELALQVGLSPSRLMHIFTRSTGLPLRPYLRWLKLQKAVISIATGSSITQAALDAGFADSAHLSRVFREGFGMRPTDLAAPLRDGARDVGFTR